MSGSSTSGRRSGGWRRDRDPGLGPAASAVASMPATVPGGAARVGWGPSAHLPPRWQRTAASGNGEGFLMLGRDHAISGVTAGAAYSTQVAHYHLPQAVMFSALTGALVMIPDADQRCSSAGRSLGPLSGVVAGAIG